MTDCRIVEDLLPLYEEGLIQPETKAWIEDHFKRCPTCAEKAAQSELPLQKEVMPEPMDHEKMMSKITFKISIYQLILVGISFFLAIQTSIVKENFEFILAYTLLGLVTYLFYKNIFIVMLVSFVPVFAWQLIDMFSQLIYNADQFSESRLEFGLNFVMGAGLWAGLHLLFSIIGMMIAMLIFKIRDVREYEDKT